MERAYWVVSCREFGSFAACRKAKRSVRLPPVGICDHTRSKLLRFRRKSGTLLIMTDWIGETPRTLNELQAFDAMRLFIEAYWDRGGKKSDDLAVLLGNLEREIWVNSMPGDPAQWRDFREAVSVTLFKNTEGAVEIKPRPVAEVYCSLQRNGPPLSLADMDAAVFEEAKRREDDKD